MRIAARMWGPLFSITQSARCDIAASDTSARDASPFLALCSRTCVAQMTGTSRGLAIPENILL